MSAYFRKYKKGDKFQKVLIRKKEGSKYPNLKEFNSKITLLEKYLKDFVVSEKIYFFNNHYYLEHEIIKGEDLFVCLKTNPKNIKNFKKFVFSLNKLYKNEKILPDLLGSGNILVDKNGIIKIVDVLPLFFIERVKNKDLYKSSYNENLDKLKLLN